MRKPAYQACIGNNVDVGRIVVALVLVEGFTGEEEATGKLRGQAISIVELN